MIETDTPIFAVALAVDLDSQTASDYPMMGGADSRHRRNAYWTLALVAMATMRRSNSWCRRVVYTNDPSPPNLLNRPMAAWAELLGFTVIHKSFSRFVPPSSLSKKYRNAFYKLDILADLSEQTAPFCIADTDCLVVGDLTTAFARTREEGLLALNVYGANQDTKTYPHGVTPDDFRRVYRHFPFWSGRAFPVWYGGEFLMSTPAQARLVCQRLGEVWKTILSDPRPEVWSLPNGWTILDGDELVMSAVLSEMGPGSAAPYVKRLWTTEQGRNVAPGDVELPVWHLPAEKGHGLPPLLRAIRRPRSRFWRLPQTAWRDWLSRRVGIQRRSRLSLELRTIRQSLAGLVRKVAHRIARNLR